MKIKLLSRVQLFATPWTAAYQAPLSMGFSRQEYWSGLPLPNLAHQLFFQMVFFMSGCTGSWLLRGLFSSFGKQGLLFSCGVRTSPCGGFSCCGAEAPGCVQASVAAARGLAVAAPGSRGAFGKCLNFPGIIFSPQSRLTLFCHPMDCNPLGSSVYEIPRQEQWSGLPFLSPPTTCFCKEILLEYSHAHLFTYVFSI